MLKLNKDYFNRPVIPAYILCKSNKEKIGSIHCTSKKMSYRFNDINEIYFDTYLYIDGERNENYDLISEMKYILLPKIGFYYISDIELHSEGSKHEYKSVTAKSYESLLAQKYLEEFVINTGTVESIDGVQFYNMANKSKSLLHLVLEKCPDWKIGHIDISLTTMQRSFEISRQDVYSFLMEDVATTFECVFLFDTINNTINIYKEKDVGNDTNISVSYNNLLKSTNISCSTDSIKTCLTLTGDDGLTIREINMGYDKIYNFEYYNSLEYMSRSLYDAYNKWIVLRNSKVDEYTALLLEYQKYIVQINDLTHNKIPSDPESTNWTEYGLNPLKEQLAKCEQRQSLMMKSGWGNENSKYYTSNYLPLYNTIQDINAQISVLNAQLDALKSSQSIISTQMSDIISLVSMQNNFTEEQLKELTNFIREDELSSDNFVVTDIMTDDERFEMLNEFLKYGNEELQKISVPQLTFNSEILNLFSIPEFDVYSADFEPGNYIHITLRDDYKVKARILTADINFYDMSDFSVTFGTITKKEKTLYTDFSDALSNFKSAATSVSFNASKWNQTSKDTDTIGKIIDEGLLAAGKYLQSGYDAEMVIDSRGIFINTTSGPNAGLDSIFIGGGRILFSDDNWKTVRMSVGRADVTIKGVTESKFGTFADFVIAGYIAGSIIEGTDIYGGKLQSLNYEKGKIGSLIDLNNAVFEFNANGEQKLVLGNDGILTVKGTIKADKGYIGGINGFTIEDGKIYSGSKSSFNSPNPGVYIGTDGISLGTNNFTADSAGNLNANNVNIKGTVKVDSGYLGGQNGFGVTGNGNFYNGKPSVDSPLPGVYVGIDGISVGAGNPFRVTATGDVYIKDADVEMTGGWINIQSDVMKGGIIKLSRPVGISTEMGTDGVRAIAGNRVATFQYSQVSVENNVDGMPVIAQLTDSGKGISSYGWESYSDRRLKHDIKPLDIEKSAEFIYAQNPCSFKFNYDKRNKTRHGLIAQDVKEKMTDPTWAVCESNFCMKNEEYYTLNYTELIADLIATAQSQNKRIYELEKEINILKNQGAE